MRSLGREAEAEVEKETKQKKKRGKEIQTRRRSFKGNHADRTVNRQRGTGSDRK